MNSTNMPIFFPQDLFIPPKSNNTFIQQLNKIKPINETRSINQNHSINQIKPINQINHVNSSHNKVQSTTLNKNLFFFKFKH